MASEFGVFAAIGLTILLTKSEVLSFYRSAISRLGARAAYLAHCPMCTGFWVGLASVLAQAGSASTTTLVRSFATGCIVSAGSALYAALADALNSVASAAILLSLKSEEEKLPDTKP